MREIRITVGLVVAMCLLAIAATSAVAAEFNASPIGKTKGKSIEGQVQEFEFGPRLIIQCEKASAKGTDTESPSPTLATTVKYSKCVRVHGPEGFGENLNAHFLGSVEYQYHNNGYVELQGEVEIKVSGLKCIIDWPSQIIPIKAEIDPSGTFSAATYTNDPIPSEKLRKFPSGFQQKLLIANEFKGMEWDVSEGDCEEWKKEEGKSGKYVGSMLMEVPGGNLSFQ